MQAAGPETVRRNEPRWLASSVVTRACAAAVVLVIGLVLAAGPGPAHEQGYGFIYADQPTQPVYSPAPSVSYNDGGGSIQITRTSVGRYTVEFEGLADISTHGGTMQVTAVEPGTHYCNAVTWNSLQALVACYDLAGAASDARFNVLLLRPDDHANDYGFAWVNDATSATSTPSTFYAYNTGPASDPGTPPISVVRHRIGHYTIEWQNLDLAGDGPRVDLVTAYGGNARCQIDGTIPDGFNVRCHAPGGAAVDSRFNALSMRTEAGADGLGFAYADSAFSNGYVIVPDDAYNASGSGDVTAERLGPGDYTMTWSGLDSVGINLGQLQVSADGFYDRLCGLESSDEDSASVRCVDSSGNPADSRYRALFLKPPKKTWSQSYAYVWANQPTTASYVPNTLYSFNPAGSSIVVTRSSTGVYTVVFDGYDVYGPFGHVQVSATGSVARHCKVVSWFDETANVRCFTSTGALVDSAFTLLYLKPDPGPTNFAHAWASQPSTASYTPNPLYTRNPGLGPVTATRSAPGLYSISFTGLGAFGFNGGHVQVTAYGGSSTRCQVTSWSSSTANVRCFNSSGVLVDSAYNILIMRPDANEAALGFAWSNESSSASYTPSTGYAFNSGGGAVTGQRSGTGAYVLTFDGLAEQGLGQGTPLITSYGSTPRTCTASAWVGGLVGVRCFDASGAQADSRFNVLWVKATNNTVLDEDTTPVPEPSGATGLLVGILSLAALVRRANATREGSFGR